MKILRAAIALAVAVSIPLQAFAEPHVIAQLGTAPLIGQIASTPQLQADVKQQRRLFETAAIKLGLTPAQYATFLQRIDTRQLTYVTIPRRLDAMSWASGGHVYVLRDVVIPANTRGWETDIVERGQVVALFIPARCGNLSVLRTPLPVIAQAPTPAPVIVKPVETAPPAVPAIVMPASPAPTVAPYASVASTTPTVTHHFRLWPLLLIPIIAFIGHGGTTMPPITNAPANHLPPPPPVTAPSPPPPSGCGPTSPPH